MYCQTDVIVFPTFSSTMVFIDHFTITTLRNVIICMITCDCTQSYVGTVSKLNYHCMQFDTLGCKKCFDLKLHCAISNNKVLLFFNLDSL